MGRAALMRYKPAGNEHDKEIVTLAGLALEIMAAGPEVPAAVAPKIALIGPGKIKLVPLATH